MTFREAWNTLIGPRLRKSNAVPQSERDSRRMGETEAERLRNAVKGSREQ